MGLRVWLPLNGDLKNQGLNEVTPTGTAFSLNDNGKIGKCIKTTNTGAIDLGYSGSQVNTGGISFGGWFKFNKSEIENVIGSYNYNNINNSATGNLIGNHSYGGIGLIWLTNNIYKNNNEFSDLYVFASIRSTKNDLRSTNNMRLEFDTWYHIFFVFDKQTKLLQLWINGSLKHYSTMVDFDDIPNRNLKINNKGTFGGNSPSFNIPFLVNDVRIYDHALSLKEIKEISKGLVLHYPLNKNGWGHENLLIDTYNWSTLTNSNKNQEGYWYNSGGVSVRYYDEINNITYCKIWHSETSSWTRYCRQYVTMQPNTYYTVSILCKINTSKAHLSIRNDRNSAITFFANNVEITNKNWQWKTFTAITHANTSQEPFIVYAHLNSDEVLSSETSIDIAMIKLEKGSIATPWCPNSSDELATTLGLNNNVIYDVSGFGNDGISNNIVADSSTPRYICSTVFNGTNSYIKAINFDWISQYPQELTVSIWGYADNWATRTSGRLWSCTESGGFNIEAGTSGYWRFPVYCSTKSDNSSHSYVYKNDALKLSDLSSGWHMITWVYTTTNQKVYVDGELYSTYTYQTYGIRFNKNARLFLGCEANSASPSSPYFNGNLSDFRIYVTALSEEDIKNLYEVTASADADNNYYVYSYNELTQNREIEYLYDLHKDNSSGTFAQNKNGLNLNNKIWVYHGYVPINPTGKTYKYDITYSCDAGNQFYIGWERYDANKTSRSNSACVYVISTKPSTDVVMNRVKGTVNLSTDGVNPCAFIKLRILNKWTGSDSDTQGKATIHSLSLKEYSNDNVLTPLNHTKQGIVNTTEIIESDIGVSINDTYELKSNNFYEI